MDVKTLPLFVYTSMSQWKETGFEVTPISFWPNLACSIGGALFEDVPDISPCFTIAAKTEKTLPINIAELNTGVQLKYEADLDISCFSKTKKINVSIVDIDRNKKYYDTFDKPTPQAHQLRGELLEYMTALKTEKLITDSQSIQPNDQGEIFAAADNFFELNPADYSRDLDNDGHPDTPIGVIYDGTDPKYIIIWEQAE